MVIRSSILARCRLLLPAAIVLAFGGISHSALAQVNLYEQTVNIASFGGSYTRSQMLAFVRPWEASTGKVANMHDYNGGLAEIRSQVASANVIWDVVDMEKYNLISACNDGLLEPVDSSLYEDGSDGTPASEDIAEEYREDCGYPNVIWSTVVGYNDDAFPNEKPDSIADFFNIDQFPGKRGLRREPQGLLEWALIADGVAASDLYSTLATAEGLERAFDVASRIKPYIVWWSTGDQPAKMLAGGNVVMSSAWNGRLYGPIVDDNAPLKIIWDGQIVETDYWAILKGSPRIANAKDFIRFAQRTENLAAQTNYISYGPVRKSSQALIGDKVKPYLPTSNLERAIRVDSQWWAQNMGNVGELFEEWLKPKTEDVDRAVRF